MTERVLVDRSVGEHDRAAAPLFVPTGSVSKPPAAERRVLSPRLLVSVRSVVEAEAAWRAGADWIDIKEPAEGSLGRASEAVWESIADWWEGIPVDSRPPLSAALGELSESLLIEALPRIPAAISTVKLGLRGSCERGSAKSLPGDSAASEALPPASARDWQQPWQAERGRWEAAAGRRLLWIAVAYADWQAAAAPCPEDVIAAARTADCAGVLLDTCLKSQGNLLTLVGHDLCRAWVDQIRRVDASAATSTAVAPRNPETIVALAGRLTLADLPAVVRFDPDVIAVRSAVCQQGSRLAGINCDAVTFWKRRIREESLREEC